MNDSKVALKASISVDVSTLSPLKALIRQPFSHISISMKHCSSKSCSALYDEPIMFQLQEQSVY